MNKVVYRSKGLPTPRAAAPVDNQSEMLDQLANLTGVNHNWCQEEDEFDQRSTQSTNELQYSVEDIHVIDSTDVTVTTVDIKATLSLQATLQAAIALVLKISIADDGTSQKVTQELVQSLKTQQISVQRTHVKNSHNILVASADAQVAVNVQLLLQLLIAILVQFSFL